jgi:hypothetical protein
MNVADSAPPLAKWVNHPYAIDRSANVPVRGTEPVMDERHAAMTAAARRADLGIRTEAGLPGFFVVSS